MKNLAVANSSNGVANTFGQARQRVDRLYRCKGGPLAGWLLDEVERRAEDSSALGRHLGMTRWCVMQYLHGRRDFAELSQKQFEAVSQYLGVPAVIVKILAGNIRGYSGAT